MLANGRKSLKEWLIRAQVRDMPFEKFHDIISDLLYGTMFTNYFARRHRAAAEQAKDIFDMVLFGILSDSEREKRRRINVE